MLSTLQIDHRPCFQRWNLTLVNVFNGGHFPVLHRQFCLTLQWAQNQHEATRNASNMMWHHTRPCPTSKRQPLRRTLNSPAVFATSHRDKAAYANASQKLRNATWRRCYIRFLEPDLTLRLRLSCARRNDTGAAAFFDQRCMRTVSRAENNDCITPRVWV